MSNSRQFVTFRRGWTTALMPEISPLGVTEEQAIEEMMARENAPGGKSNRTEGLTAAGRSASPAPS